MSKQRFRKIDQNPIFDGGTLVTNFNNDNRPLMEQAIAAFEQMHGNSGLEICDIATDHINQPLHGCCSLHSRTGEFPAHISDFWAIHQKLRDAAIVAEND